MPESATQQAPASQPPASQPPRRSYVACRRCHTQKIKCSGGDPCRACQASSKPIQCLYPARSRKVRVSDAYVKTLEAENEALKKLAAATPTFSTSNSTSIVHGQEDSLDRQRPSALEEDETTPIFEEGIQSEPNHTSAAPIYIGETACAAFGFRVRHYAKSGHPSTAVIVPNYYVHSILQRCSAPSIQLPGRAYARMLVQVVLRFVGPDYHYLTRQSIFRRLENVYRSPASAEPVLLCKLFTIMALGELYTKRFTEEGHVPGTPFFLQATAILEDIHEEATVEYIQTLVLMSFYSLALNRKRTAYAYSGTALRLSLTLGLHRNAPQAPGITREAVEEQRRVWWTVYTYDRLLGAKLGLPLSVQDDDIDTPLPSLDGLSAEGLADFLDPSHLLANIRLSTITGTITKLVYSISAPKKGTNFVHNVHKILTSLREVDSDLPDTLKSESSASSPHTRHVASLRLHFDQCIILTTRPILLHVFRYYLQPQAVENPTNVLTPPSPTISALAEACISAARASNKLLVQLWIEGNLATFGYFDAHYLFASTIVLIMSHILAPSPEDKEAIETAHELLKSMVDAGNMPAKEYRDRLELVQQDLGGLPPLSSSRQSKGAMGAETGSRGQDATQSAGVSSGQEQLQEMIADGSRYQSQVNNWNATLENPTLQDFFVQSQLDFDSGSLDLVAPDDMDLWNFQF